MKRRLKSGSNVRSAQEPGRTDFCDTCKERPFPFRGLPFLLGVYSTLIFYDFLWDGLETPLALKDSCLSETFSHVCVGCAVGLVFERT